MRSFLGSFMGLALVMNTAYAAPSRALPNKPRAATTSGPSAPVLQSCASHMDGKLPASIPADFFWSGNVRKYYVAAEEVEWDYAPTGWDNWLGLPLDKSPRANQSGALDYGTKWLKALYRGYTNENFTTYSPQPAWQGTQGPTLRSEVGDMIEIMFVNKLSKNYATMHSMGLAYSKYSEGSSYPNATMAGQNVTLPEAESVPPLDHGVEPGSCVVYKWLVNEANGPDPGMPSTIHSYHSFVSLQQDADAGLIGPQIVYAPGQMEHTMASHREFPVLFMTYDESDSWLSAQNNQALNKSAANSSSVSSSIDMTLADLPSGNRSVWYPQLTNFLGANQFEEAPTYYGLNGYIFANNPTYEMCLNDKVIWYINAYGTMSHVFHMHGNGFTYNGHKNYAVNLGEGEGKTLFMDATGAGLWQFLCHVDDHLSSGMVSNYRVFADNCPLPKLEW